MVETFFSSWNYKNWGWGSHRFSLSTSGRRKGQNIFERFFLGQISKLKYIMYKNSMYNLRTIKSQQRFKRGGHMYWRANFFITFHTKPRLTNESLSKLLMSSLQKSAEQPKLRNRYYSPIYLLRVIPNFISLLLQTDLCFAVVESSQHSRFTIYR